MPNTNQQVWKLLRSDLAIQKDLARGVVNMRAVAKYLIQHYGLTASLDAVISAIRRFESQETFKKENEHMLNLFKDASVSTRSNIACITIEQTPAEFFAKICATDSIPFKLVTGTNEVKLLVNETNVDQVTTIFNEKDIRSVQKGLSEISVALSKKASSTKGVAARITSEIALAQINIAELLVCQPEFLIYVTEKDLVKAHESVMKLVRGD